MPISCTPASTWPAKFAYLSASIFIAASGSVNLIYGIGKGSDPASSAVWGAVSVAASITFALSWPALIRAAGNRSFSGAVVAIVALLLVRRLLNLSRARQRWRRSHERCRRETASTDARKRAQSAYDLAKAAHDAARTEMATLKPTRPVGELEAMRKSWHASMGKRDVWFYEPSLPGRNGGPSWRRPLRRRPARWRPLPASCPTARPVRWPTPTRKRSPVISLRSARISDPTLERLACATHRGVDGDGRGPVARSWTCPFSRAGGTPRSFADHPGRSTRPVFPATRARPAGHSGHRARAPDRAAGHHPGLWVRTRRPRAHQPPEAG